MGAGYCTEAAYRSYMQENCCQSCGGGSNDGNSGTATCESQLSNMAGGYRCGDRINWLKRNRGMDESTARATVAGEYPNECGACAGSGSDTGDSNGNDNLPDNCQGDTNENCEAWANDGYCQGQYQEYMSNYCCASCHSGNSVDNQDRSSETCVGLSAQKAKNEAVNIMLVPSGFGGDMAKFANRARWVYSKFNDYPPTAAEHTPLLNVWYVPVDVPGDNGNMCYFNCNNIQRLLCCHNIEKIKQHSKTHCGTGYVFNVIVIHNSEQYGGAGYTHAGVGTTSLADAAPNVAVHELGHSLFRLGDEYTYQQIGDTAPNCDNAGCPKWADMIGKFGTTCAPNACAGGRYFSDGDTMMKYTGKPFGAVNERISCCTYYFHLGGNVPDYCAKFSTQGLSLGSFCENLRGRHPFAMSTGAIGQTIGTGAYVKVDRPVEWHLVRMGLDNAWVCNKAPNQPQGQGVFERSAVFGDEDAAAVRGYSPIQVLIKEHDADKRILKFNTYESFESPPTDGQAEAFFQSPKSHATIILQVGETCAVISNSTDGDNLVSGAHGVERSARLIWLVMGFVMLGASMRF